MAKTLIDFNALLTQVGEKATKIAADVQRLIDLKGGLTGDEENALYDNIQATLSALSAVDDLTPEPVPVPDPEEPEA